MKDEEKQHRKTRNNGGRGFRADFRRCVGYSKLGQKQDYN